MTFFFGKMWLSKIVHNHVVVIYCWIFPATSGNVNDLKMLWASRPIGIAYMTELTYTIPSSLSSLVAILKRSNRRLGAGDIQRR